MGHQAETPILNKIINHPICTYASLVDPAEGTTLKCIPMAEIDGQKCSKIDKTDVLSEAEYWSTAVICGYVRRIWSRKSIDNVVMARKGVIRFINMQDKLDVTQRRVCFFDKKPFIVKAWKETLKSLSKLGIMLSTPIKTDRTIKEKATIKYARLLIEMSLVGPFPEYIDFVNDWEVVVRQKVHYEWKSIHCNQYQMLGHEEQHCRKKNKVRQEWRVVIREGGIEPIQQEEEIQSPAY
ncbi:hypothetical protein Cgig2_018358 [Carnegiea gigantea]|uniref:Uncharacterized protein n=1 Tax=Carnegiea gigantea TaxID=171969 RepID=A0A9Q1JQ75_9CARY|nr:hypothetical protein Cgig2_018358 [Carnegiea gigantea]